jgi:hypothetical protein
MVFLESPGLTPGGKSRHKVSRAWEQLGGGFPNPYQSMVECIEFDPETPDHVFAGAGG